MVIELLLFSNVKMVHILHSTLSNGEIFPYKLNCKIDKVNQLTINKLNDYLYPHQ